MSLSTYLLEYGRHVARLRRRRRRRRRRAYAPTSNTASHDNHKKILHGFPFLSRDDYGAPLGGPSGRRSSAIILRVDQVTVHTVVLRLCNSPNLGICFGKTVIFLSLKNTKEHE